MSKPIIIFLVLLLLLILVLVLYIIYIMMTFKRTPYSFTFDQIKSSLKTGDILLFSRRDDQGLIDNIVYNARTKLLHNEYGHVGIIYRDDNGQLFVIEAVKPDQIAEDYAYYYKDARKGGLRIIDMDTLMYRYSKEAQAEFGLMFINKAIDNKLLTSNLDYYKNTTFRNGIIMTLLAFVDTAISNKQANWLAKHVYHKDRLMCSEFVYDILQRCGVVKPYTSSIFWPHLFTNGVFDKLAEGRYSECVKFVV